MIYTGLLDELSMLLFPPLIRSIGRISKRFMSNYAQESRRVETLTEMERVNCGRIDEFVT